MPCASVVALSRVAVEPGSSPYTFDTNSEIYDFNGSTMSIEDSIMFSNTIRGTRSQAVEQSRQGPSWIRGTISFPVDVAAMDLWLPRILGAAESSDTFALAETLPSFGILADLVGNTHEFKDCYIHQADFVGKAWSGQGIPQPLECRMTIYGKSEAAGTTFPALTLSTDANRTPLMFEEGVFNIAGANRDILQFRLTITNHLRVRFTNSLTPTCIFPAGRTVGLMAVTPYTAGAEATGATKIYGNSYGGSSATITFTNGNTSLGFTLGRFQYPKITPKAVGRGEILHICSGNARSVTTTKELVATNDSTV